MTTPSFDDPAFVPAMLAALAERSPLTARELAARIGEQEGLVAEELSYRADVYETKQGWYSVPILAEGAVLTHLVMAEEIALGVLRADGDLDLWARLAEDGLPYAGGGQLETVFQSFATLPAGAAVGLTGPPGWLDGLREHDVIALRLTGGVLSLTQDGPGTAPDIDCVTVLVECAQAAAEAAALEEPENGPGALLDEIVLQALIVRPDLLAAPMSPLAVLLMVMDLEVRRGLVGLPGTDWDGTGASTEGLAPADRRRVAAIRNAMALMDPDQINDPATLRSTLDLLIAGGPPLELLAVDLSCEPTLHARVHLLAEAAESPPQQAVAAYLLAVLAEYDGRVPEALDHLGDALAVLPNLPEALLMAASFASDRGEARVADELYRRAGQDKDSPWRLVLNEFLLPAPSPAGRNKPCLCGSGRKHKVCCGPTTPYPLPQRAQWRYQRAVLWALRPAQQETLLDLAEALAGSASSEEDFEDALTDPLLTNLALVEESLLADYLLQRGPLMPPDERALVSSWLTRPLTLWEVQSTRPGFDLTVRALPDGEAVTVRGPLLSREVERMDLLLGRLLPDGLSQQFLCPPKWIPRTQRTRLLAALEVGDSYALLAALAPAPLPELVNTENDPVVMCTARYVVAPSAWETLARDLADDGDELVELINIKGDLVQRGRFRQVEGDLELSTNSVERLARLTGRLLAVDPAATLLEESQVPAAELMTSEAVLPGGLSLSPSLPAHLQDDLMAQLGASAEQRWLADNIPALDGMTPRAAADDPVMRPRLVALLDDFAWQERNSSQPAIMQAARLRTALGLPG